LTALNGLDGLVESFLRSGSGVVDDFCHECVS
jgi:hypothetical protein